MVHFNQKKLFPLSQCSICLPIFFAWCAILCLVGVMSQSPVGDKSSRYKCDYKNNEQRDREMVQRAC